MSRHRKIAHSAFTLIELMVVIGIIVILVALLFPVIVRAQRTATQTKSLSNVRQMLLAFTAYVDDNDGRMPAEGMQSTGLNIEREDAWFNVLPRYAGEKAWKDLITTGPRRAPRPGDPTIFMCPAFKMNELLAPPANARTPVFSYAYNLWIDHPDRAAENGGRTSYSPGRLHWSDIQPFAAHFVIFGCCGPTPQNPSCSKFDNMAAMHIHYRFMGGRNTVIGFADGHVAAYPRERVYVDVSEGKAKNRGVIWNPDGEHF